MNFTVTERPYMSRRSVVMTRNVAVATSQPLATEAGLATLRAGGSAADAAVAVAAALQVTKPCATGLGGDAFFLYFEAETGAVHAYNGSGRSPARLTAELARRVAVDDALPDRHPYTVTVPGAADTWISLHEKFGRLSLETVLGPAIRLADEGCPVSEVAARWWAAGAEELLSRTRHGRELMIDGRAPRPGELFRNPGLVSVFTDLAARGREGFYGGRIADSIVAAVAEAGGLLTHADLEQHGGEWTHTIGTGLGGYRILECPPNGQGLAALIALGIYRHLAPAAGPDQLHAMIESMRLAFADAARHIADPRHADIPVDHLLSDEYLSLRASLVQPDRRIERVEAGAKAGHPGSDTVYFAVVDEEGNGCSFINSNFMGFGTGIVPRGCGFSLQNRGRGFSLVPGHNNEAGPNKRPYHTIIPGLIVDAASGDLAAVFGIMGGMMQPQAHLQVARALIEDGADPQAALDRPRFMLEGGDANGRVFVEDSMPATHVAALRRKGHTVELVTGDERTVFGLGQIIARGDGSWWSGSDPRGDGHAAGY